MTGLGGQGLEDYEPPSAELASLLSGPEEAAPEKPLRGPEREAQVRAFIAMAGGEG